MAKEIILNAAPPLIGNRRIGPDLLNVGIRRSKEWLKLHMIYPGVLTPNSKMPSYSYLFNNSKGDSLVTYLVSLGEGRSQERLEIISNWKPNYLASIDSNNVSSNVIELYEISCAQCHGISGTGDGLAGKMLTTPPRNLVKDKFIYIDETSENLKDSLSRIIKFGIHGTSMPGHETLNDGEILGLSNFILSLRKQ